MITDCLDNLGRYLPPALFSKIEPFLSQLSPDMEERVYSINGDAIYARVMSYATSPPHNCKVEAHNRYIDIQSTLAGEEGIAVYSRKALRMKEPYQEDTDAVFFFADAAQQYSQIRNYPGRFTLLFPQEAHQPQLQIGSEAHVKKFVIKLAVSYYEQYI